MKMMIDSNNINNMNWRIDLPQLPQWTYPSYCSKVAKTSTNLRIFQQFLGRGMSSDLFTDTGHPPSFECSTTRYNKSSFSIFGLISCVKSVLKRVKDKTIKKFYLSEGMSTVSTVSRGILKTGKDEELK